MTSDYNLMKHVLVLCEQVQACIEESKRLRANAKANNFSPGDLPVADRRLPLPPSEFTAKFHGRRLSTPTAHISMQ